jgi:transcriptional regulator with XRE-family HTH domain
MARTTVDVRALYAALDAARKQKGLSWRQLAKEIGVSPSTMTRMGNDQKPEVNAFAAMVRWLNLPAEDFMVHADQPAEQSQREEPELVAQLAPLLRARKDLDADDVRYLEELIAAAVRRFDAERASRQR